MKIKTKNLKNIVDLGTIECPENTTTVNFMTPKEGSIADVINDMNKVPELSLKEILFIERQRREISKKNFLLSSSTSSVTPTPSLPLVTLPVVNKTATHSELKEDERCKSINIPLYLSEDNDVKTASRTPPNENLICNIQKSSSTSSSLHLLYTNLLRRMQPISRKHLSSNTEDEEEAIDVCDVNGGEASEDYHNIKIKQLDSRDHRIVAKSLRRQCQSLYEISDTGGVLTTVDDSDFDSNINQFSSLSYNSGNINTSIESHYKLDEKLENAQNVILTACALKACQTIKTPTLVTQALMTPSDGNSNAHEKFSKTAALLKAKMYNLSPFKGVPNKGGSLSGSPNSSDCSSHSPVPDNPLKIYLSAVNRSKSFQESGVKQYTRKKDYTRLFRRRSKKRTNASRPISTKTSKKSFSLDTTRQSIEITIQDEHGNYQPYDDDYLTLKDGRSGLSRSGYTDDDNDFDDGFEQDLIRHVKTEYQTPTYSSEASSPTNFHMYLDDQPHSFTSDDATAGDISDGGSSRSRSRVSDNEEHVFGRLLRRMQCLSLGWRKHRYYKRRGD